MSLKSSNIEQFYTVCISINNDKFIKIKQNDKYFVIEQIYIKYIDFFFCVEIIHFLNKNINFLVEYQNNNFDIINGKHNDNGQSCLIFACIDSDLNIIDFLLRIGANIHDRDNLGKSCLMYACVEGDLDIVLFLLLNGANISDTDITGTNCLMFACANGNLDIVELLLDKGANINDLDSNGENCLMYALKSELYSDITLNIIKLLLSKGVNIHITNAFGETCFSLGEFMRWNSVLYSLRKWPTTMGIIIFQELGLEGFMDNDSICDLIQYLGKEDFTLDNEDDYEKDADGDVINFVYESDSDDDDDDDD